MITIGIDPGTTCGIAAVSETHVAWTTVHLPSWRHHCMGAGWGHEQGIEVLVDALHELCKLLWRDNAAGCVPVRGVAIEDSQHAVSMRAAAVQAEHLALAAMAASHEAWDVYPVHPATWQHGIVGGLGRGEYVRYASEVTGGALLKQEHDAAAAVCMAEWLWQREAARVR